MRGLILNVPRSIALLVESVLLLFAPGLLVAQSTITNVMSPVASYQYEDSLTDTTSSPIISPVVSYQFYDSLTDMGRNSVIVSPIASYQYFDWPDTAVLQILNSPSVSYFFETTGQGSTSLTTQGKVIDSTGAPMANATITASVFSTPAATALSALDGTYTLPALAPGAYQYAAAANGYVADERVVSLSSATAQQNFLLSPLPLAPQTQTSDSTPISEVPDDIQGATLEVFDGTVFRPNLKPDSTKMTVVLTHGWVQCLEPGFPIWPTAMAQAMQTADVSSVANIVAWDWHQAANACLDIPWVKTYDQGTNLGWALYHALGSGYSRPIHFIGHSLGTMVNAEAANYLTGNRVAGEPVAPTAWNAANIHLTMLDEAELASQDVQLAVTAFKSGFTSESVANIVEPSPLSPIPQQWQSYKWIDNYISAFGLVHPEAVNVYLPEAADLFSHVDLFDSAQNMHGYAVDWYRMTVTNSIKSDLGFVNSFEWSELFGNALFPPDQLDYEAGSGFDQDDNPNNPLEVQSAPPPLPINWNAPFLPLAAPSGFQQTFFPTEVGISFITLGVQATVDTVGSANATVCQHESVAVNDAFNYVVGQTAQPVVDLLNQPQLCLSLITTAEMLPLNRRRPALPLPQGGNPSGSNMPAALWMTASVPTEASELIFDFTVSGNGAQDSIVFGVGDTSLFSLALDYLTPGQSYSSGPIDISAYAGTTTNQFFFGVLGGTSTNANVAINDIEFLSFSSPQLSISQSNGAIALYWPSGANGYTLQSSTSLSATEWPSVTNVPSLFGGFFTVTNSWPDQARFFRLQSQ